MATMNTYFDQLSPDAQTYLVQLAVSTLDDNISAHDHERLINEALMEINPMELYAFGKVLEMMEDGEVCKAVIAKTGTN